MLAILAKLCVGKTVFGFDTFNGLPRSHWDSGEYHKPGEFSTKASEVREFLDFCRLDNVRLIKGLFPKSAGIVEKELRQICFAHVDVDFYQGTKESLTYIWPRLTPNGVIVVDDYGTPDCPRVKEAVDEVAAEVGAEVHAGATGQAWLRKETK